MTRLFEIILKIFKVVFEEDVKRRRPRQRMPRPPRPGQPGAPGGRAPRAGGPGGTGSTTVDDFLSEILGLEPPPPPPPPPPPKAVARPQQPPPPRPPESFKQHLARFEAGLDDVGEEALRRMDADPGDLDEYMDHWDGAGAAGASQATGGLHVLPGQSPLAQLIYAQVILGSCKGIKQLHGDYSL